MKSQKQNIEKGGTGYQLGDSSTVNNYFAFDEVKDFGIIEDIFKYIYDNVLEIGEVYEVNKDKLTDLKIKIPLNFKGVDRKNIENYFSNLWRRKDLIQQFISNENQEKVIALKIEIQKKITEK